MLMKNYLILMACQPVSEVMLYLAAKELQILYIYIYIFRVV